MLHFVFTMLSTYLFALIPAEAHSLTPAPTLAASCPQKMEIAYIIVVTEDDLIQKKSTQFPQVSERYSICAGLDINRKINEFAVVRTDKNTGNVTRFTVDEFTKSSYVFRRKIATYGEVMVNALYCQTCDWSQSQQKLGYINLHSFSIFGSKYHDYRRTDITVDQTTGSPRFSRPKGRFNVIQVEQGRWGINAIRFSRCVSQANEAETECLSKNAPPLSLVENIDLDDETKYPAIAPGQTRF